MTVRVMRAVSSTPGEQRSMLIVHFGIDGEPRNTTRDQIVAAFTAIDGIQDVGAPEEMIQRGTWSMMVARGTRINLAKDRVLQTARRIAGKG